MVGAPVGPSILVLLNSVAKNRLQTWRRFSASKRSLPNRESLKACKFWRPHTVPIRKSRIVEQKCGIDCRRAKGFRLPVRVAVRLHQPQVCAHRVPPKRCMWVRQNFRDAIWEVIRHLGDGRLPHFKGCHREVVHLIGHWFCLRWVVWYVPSVQPFYLET